MSAITKAIVPAAGLGTRLYPATKSQPKEMLPLGPKPVIQMVAEELARSGVTDVLLVTGPKKRAIEDHFDPGDGIHPEESAAHDSELFHSHRVKFHYVRQSAPRGLGDAVLQGDTFAGADDFVVALGDCAIVGRDGAALLERMLEVHRAAGAAATVAVQTVPQERTSRYGIVDPAGFEGEALRLRDIVEKPGPAAAPSNLAVCARYVFAPRLFEYLRNGKPGAGGEIQLTDAIRAMIRDGLAVYAVPLSGAERRLDVGSFDSYGRAFVRAMVEHPTLGPPFAEYIGALAAHLANPLAPDPDAT